MTISDASKTPVRPAPVSETTLKRIATNTAKVANKTCALAKTTVKSTRTVICKAGSAIAERVDTFCAEMDRKALEREQAREARARASQYVGGPEWLKNLEKLQRQEKVLARGYATSREEWLAVRGLGATRYPSGYACRSTNNTYGERSSGRGGDGGYFGGYGGDSANSWAHSPVGYSPGGFGPSSFGGNSATGFGWGGDSPGGGSPGGMAHGNWD